MIRLDYFDLCDENLHQKFPDRKAFWHKQWGPVGACPECYGRGIKWGCVPAFNDAKHDCERHSDECWHDDRFYCSCALGRDRAQAER